MMGSLSILKFTQGIVVVRDDILSGVIHQLVEFDLPIFQAGKNMSTKGRGQIVRVPRLPESERVLRACAKQNLNNTSEAGGKKRGYGYTPCSKTLRYRSYR
jgi:hypothetical protein